MIFLEGNGGRGGRGSVAMVSVFFYKESKSNKKNFFEVGGGWLG